MKAEYDFSKGKRGAVIPQNGKTRISLYIDDEILDALREMADNAGMGYHAMMNQALREYLAKSKPHCATLRVATGIPKQQQSLGTRTTTTQTQITAQA
jgi:predicted transcriptional regulator